MNEGMKTYPFTNDDIFKAVLQDKSIAREIISVVLGRKVREIRNYATQKDKKVRKLARGVRFDLYFEDDDAAYEVEMQSSTCVDLGKRCRFYQSMIDVDLLAEGDDFGNLKDSYIIFLCTYDAFGREEPLYTFETVCTNDPANTTVEGALKLDTGAKIAVCNACAYSKATDELRDFLCYLLTQKVAKNNPFIARIDEAVQIANANEEVRNDAMIADYKLRDAAAEAAEKALAQGLLQGQAKEQQRIVQMLERKEMGLSSEQKAMLMKELTLKK